MGDVGRFAGWSPAHRAALLDDLRTASVLPVAEAADRAALRKQVAACYVRWHERTSESSDVERVVPVENLLPVLLGVIGADGSAALPVTMPALEFSIYDLTSTILIVSLAKPRDNKLLRRAGRAAQQLRDRLGRSAVGLIPPDVLLNITRAVKAVRERLGGVASGPVPPDGMLKVMRAAVAVRGMAANARPPTDDQVRWARALMRASRQIAADPELNRLRVPRRLTRVRRARLRLIARAVAVHAPALLAASGPADINQIADSLTAGVCAWAHGDLAALADTIPVALRRSAWFSILRQRLLGAVLIAAAFIVVSEGSGSRYTFITPLLLLIGLQLGRTPQPVDSAKLLLSSTASIGTASH